VFPLNGLLIHILGIITFLHFLDFPGRSKGQRDIQWCWIPAYAGMTNGGKNRRLYGHPKENPKHEILNSKQYRMFKIQIFKTKTPQAFCEKSHPT